mmetsp:Transcript_98094/g.210410  ORF Transcript_98094/g.210410 Transcript_98094/m.210410 type:complete len:233 (-) Transcript_98094:53-751(-)
MTTALGFDAELGIKGHRLLANCTTLAAKDGLALRQRIRLDTHLLLETRAEVRTNAHATAGLDEDRGPIREEPRHVPCVRHSARTKEEDVQAQVALPQAIIKTRLELRLSGRQHLLQLGAFVHNLQLVHQREGQVEDHTEDDGWEIVKEKSLKPPLISHGRQPPHVCCFATVGRDKDLHRRGCMSHPLATAAGPQQHKAEEKSCEGSEHNRPWHLHRPNRHRGVCGDGNMQGR